MIDSVQHASASLDETGETGDEVNGLRNQVVNEWWGYRVYGVYQYKDDPGLRASPEKNTIMLRGRRRKKGKHEAWLR